MGRYRGTFWGLSWRGSGSLIESANKRLRLSLFIEWWVGSLNLPMQPISRQADFLMIKIIKPNKETVRKYFKNTGLIVKEIRMIDEDTFKKANEIIFRKLESDNKPI